MKMRRIGVVYCFQDAVHRAMAEVLLDGIKALGSMYSPVFAPTRYSSKDEIIRELSSKGLLTCDLLIVMGTFITDVVADFYRENGERPTLFLGVLDFEKHWFIKSKESPGGYVSGVTAEIAAPTRYAQEIIKFRPIVSSIVLPYNQNQQVVRNDAEGTIKHLEAAGFTIYGCPIKTVEDAAYAIDEYMDKVDGILFAETCIANQLAQQTAAIAWQNEKIFFSNQGAAGIKLGAAVSFGIDESYRRTYMHSVIYMIKKYFDEFVPIGRQAVMVHPDLRRCMVNKTMLRQIEGADQILMQFAQDACVEVLHEWPSEFKWDLIINHNK